MGTGCVCMNTHVHECKHRCAQACDGACVCKSTCTQVWACKHPVCTDMGRGGCVCMHMHVLECKHPCAQAHGGRVTVCACVHNVGVQTPPCTSMCKARQAPIRLCRSPPPQPPPGLHSSPERPPQAAPPCWRGQAPGAGQGRGGLAPPRPTFQPHRMLRLLDRDFSTAVAKARDWDGPNSGNGERRLPWGGNCPSQPPHSQARSERGAGSRSRLPHTCGHTCTRPKELETGGAAQTPQALLDPQGGGKASARWGWD